MSFAFSLYRFLHLLTRFCFLLTITSSLEMKDILFVERRTHSSFELVKEFFNRTLLPLCDMTANVCDINCCHDEDCNVEQIKVFDCSAQTDSLDVDPTISDAHYCHKNSSDVSSSDPVLCYEIENSPYLGKYFLEETVLKRKALEVQLQKVASSVQKYFGGNLETQVQLDKDIYKYGAPLRLSSGSLFILPTEILGKGYCSYDSPVRYLLDTSSVCTFKIDATLCEDNPKFHLQSYFDEDDVGELHLRDVYSGNASSPIAASVKILCSPDISGIEHYLGISDIYGECDDLMVVKKAVLDSVHRTCRNVVTNVEYHFEWYENYLKSVDVIVVLSDVRLDRTVSSIPSRRGVRSTATQIFKVDFDKKIMNARLDRGSYFLNDHIVLQNFT